MRAASSERDTAEHDLLDRPLTALEGGILGLLARGRKLSGWDVLRQARTSVAYFWPIGRSQIYAALPRLERMGLIQGTDVAQQGKPDKRQFELTRAGRDALAAWLDDGWTGPERDVFLLKLFFGAHASRESVRAAISERRTEARRLLEEIELMSDSPDLDDFFHGLTRDFGGERARSIVAWCDRALEALEALDQERSSR